MRSRAPHEIVAGLIDPEEARRPYAGFDWVASLLGFAVSMFFLAVFLGIGAAVVAATVGRPPVGSPTRALSSTPGQAAAGAVLAAIFLAYLIGGYGAGRVARFNGALNGFGVVLWTVLVAIGLGIAGGVLEILQFGVVQDLHLGISLHQAAVAGAIAVVPALVVMVVAGVLGGAMGGRYHRRVDRAVGVPA